MGKAEDLQVRKALEALRQGRDIAGEEIEGDKMAAKENVAMNGEAVSMGAEVEVLHAAAGEDEEPVVQAAGGELVEVDVEGPDAAGAAEEDGVDGP
jgi:hypothetical protein